MALRAATEGAQLYGGFGYMTETAVTHAFCDAKVLQIGEGSNEIQWLVIARMLGC